MNMEEKRAIYLSIDTINDKIINKKKKDRENEFPVYGFIVKIFD